MLKGNHFGKFIISTGIKGIEFQEICSKRANDILVKTFTFSAPPNLIINSLKYGVENGKTEVAIQEVNSEKIVIRINDNGEGIAEEHIPRLFERFYRVDKTGNRKQGGSGLGLAIVKHIIEAHQEKLVVESTLGVGSEFSFNLQSIQRNNNKIDR